MTRRAVLVAVAVVVIGLAVGSWLYTTQPWLPDCAGRHGGIGTCLYDPDTNSVR